MSKSPVFALVGSPNCGKSTLFNRLTGSKQKIGNFPGVTVEKKEGIYRHENQEITLVDLPGVYSLNGGGISADIQVTHDFLSEKQANIIINVIDASKLDLSLKLTLQLFELGLPIVIVLNMIDVARSHNIEIDTYELAQLLGCPVVITSAASGEGVEELKRVAALTVGAGHSPRTIWLGSHLEAAIAEIGRKFPEHSSRLLLLEAFEGNPQSPETLSPSLREALRNQDRLLRKATGVRAEILIDNARQKFIADIVAQVQRALKVTDTIPSDKIDRVLLHPWLGLPIFLLIMYMLFNLTINLGTVFVDLFDQLGDALLVDGLRQALDALGMPELLKIILANGIGEGVKTVLTFAPTIGFLFIFLSFLEDSGYMARIAIIAGNFMKALNLPGRAFVPFVIGFGCNVPAVMATRTLDRPQDRLLAAALVPFMSCGARLAVYALFAAAFFPENGGNLIFGLYLVGIMVAFLSGFILKRSIIKGEPQPLLLELPNYFLPRLGDVLLHAWVRLKGFLWDAGRIIVFMVTILGLLNALGMDGSFGDTPRDKSALAFVSQKLTPLFAPLGIEKENWPAVVGIVAGLFAKETVVGTLNVLYSGKEDRDDLGISAKLDKALGDFEDGVLRLKDKFLDPLGLSGISEPEGGEGTLSSLQKAFKDRLSVIAYLIFILLYAPCIATIAAMKREMGLKFALLISGWNSLLAYGAAVLFYQLGRLVLTSVY